MVSLEKRRVNVLRNVLELLGIVKLFKISIYEF